MPTPYYIHRAPNALTLARQVRQDVWRAVRRLRGFSPVVEVTQTDDTLHIRAGGRALPPLSPTANSRIQAVLDNQANRSRWLKHARLR